MTTPTKEQIEKVGKLIAGFIDRRTPEELAIIAITEWEKIRNKKQNACTKKSCWNYCGSNSDGCFLPESYQHRPTCFVSHKKARELLMDWEAKKEDK